MREIAALAVALVFFVAAALLAQIAWDLEARASGVERSARVDVRTLVSRIVRHGP